MTKSKQEIIADITAHIAACGGRYADWYAGITENASRRVFEEHGVEKGKDAYIWCTAVSSAVAREIEKHFLDLGCDGGGGGGDNDANIVYAYKKGIGTNP